uniref:G_PROTEIN_RECEP_F1_2 domain-containing protein n=1 Tax=Panagrellus redivivus TaxID=6233 RepID=A0A7E4VNC4_PANRE
MSSLLIIMLMIIMFSTGILTLIVAPFFIYAIVYKSSHLMSTYRTLMIAYIPFSALTTISISTTVPLYDRKACRFFFHGFVPFQDGVLSSVLAIIIFINDFVTTDILLIILINRYHTVSKHIVSHRRSVYYTFYVLIAITNIIESLTMLLLLSYSLYPTHIAVKFTFLEDIFLPITGIYQITRITAFITIVYLNLKFGIKYASTSSANVVRLHKMLTKTVVANVLTTMFFTRLPMLAIVAAISSNSFDLINLAINGGICFMNCAFLSDMLITLYFVAPYRRFVKSLWRRRTGTVVLVPMISTSHLK